MSKNKKVEDTKVNEFLTKEEIEQIEDIETKEITIPEWNNKKVRVRGMSGTERDMYDNILANHTKGEAPNQTLDMEGIRAEVVSLCLVDELGVRLFTTPSDVNILSAKSGAAISRIYDVACELSGLTREAQDLAEKNSKAAQSGNSGSGSQEPSADVQ